MMRGSSFWWSRPFVWTTTHGF